MFWLTHFLLQVVGAQGTGKTSLLRLLLDTADISPTATGDQRANMEAFLRGSPKRTEGIQTACVEICESKYDRLLLSVIDTPGLDFQNGHELKLERQVTSIVKYMDTQFADTLSEVRVLVAIGDILYLFGQLLFPCCSPSITIEHYISVTSHC